MNYKYLFFIISIAVLLGGCEGCDEVLCETTGDECTDENNAMSTIDEMCNCTVVCESFGDECTDTNGVSSEFDENCECSVVCESFGGPCIDANGVSSEFDANCECILVCPEIGQDCNNSQGSGILNAECDCVVSENNCPESGISAQQALDAGFTVANLVLNCNYMPSDFIGLTYQGGLIFHVNPEGSGLIAAPMDQTDGAAWGCEGTDIPTANPMEIGFGQANTTAILNGCMVAGTAAQICDELVIDGHADWFLPSLDELGAMYLNLAANELGNFVPEWYWSSTNLNDKDARGLNFGSGGPVIDLKDNLQFVRAVRAYTE